MNRPAQKPQSNAPAFTERRKELRKLQLSRRLRADADQVKRTETQISALEVERQRQLSRADEVTSRLAREAAEAPRLTTGRRPERPGKVRPKPALASKLTRLHAAPAPARADDKQPPPAEG